MVPFQGGTGYQQQFETPYANLKIEALESSFKQDMHYMKNVLEAQNDSFKQQFQQLLDLTNEKQLEKASAQKDLQDLKEQLQLQREENTAAQWDMATRSAHFRFDMLKSDYPLPNEDDRKRKIPHKHSIQKDLNRQYIESEEDMDAMNVYRTPAPKLNKKLYDPQESDEVLDLDALDTKYSSTV